MIQKLSSFTLIIVGFIILIFPFFSGDDAYFIGKDFYINQTDSVNLKYEPYMEQLAAAQMNKKSFKFKKELRESLKPVGDSLEVAAINANKRKNPLIIKEINHAKDSLNKLTISKEIEIENQFNFYNLPAEQQNEMIQSLKDSISRADFLIILANEAYNPKDLSSIPEVNREDINIQQINQQDKTPFLFSGILVIIAGLVFLLYTFQMLPLHNLGFKLGIIFFLIFIVALLTYNLYKSVDDRLQFENALEIRKKKVIKRLNHIRNLQLIYLEENERYSENWEELTQFTKEDSIEITKYLVNKDDSAAVNRAKRQGLPLEEIIKVSVIEKAFDGKAPFKVDSLSYIPFTKEQFELDAGVLEKNEREIHVFEVKTNIYTFIKNLPYVPENFDKDKQLILGSMLEPTTEGNW